MGSTGAFSYNQLVPIHEGDSPRSVAYVKAVDYIVPQRSLGYEFFFLTLSLIPRLFKGLSTVEQSRGQTEGGAEKENDAVAHCLGALI